MLNTLIARAALAVFLAVTPAVTAAQTVEITPFRIEGLVVGKKFVVDAAYGEAQGRPVPTPFELIVPTSDDFRTLLDNKPKGGFAKFTFATPDNGFIENMHLVEFNLPVETPDQRLPKLAKMLSEQGFAAAVQGFENPDLKGSRAITIGQLPAVEVIGTYVDPANGPMYLRLVGVPHPALPHGVFAIMNIHAQRQPVQNPDGLAETLSGKAMGSFRFQ